MQRGPGSLEESLPEDASRTMATTMGSGAPHPEQSDQELASGASVGEYIIERAAGQGGFASVYQARSRNGGDLVALKVLRQELCGSSTAVLRLRQEAEALARLEHPAIVGIRDVGELPSGAPYLVMEWIAGHTLTQELRVRGRFSLDELLGVLEPLCGALAAAHGAGIVHRDLKPSNLMLLPAGDWFRVKLVDFGIAKLVDLDDATKRGLTTTGATLGTPQYMAPEQFGMRKVDARADIYALGVISHLLLTGQLPFQGRNLVELAEQHILGKPPRVSSLVPVPSGVDEAVARCLAKQPEQRYASALEFVDDLRRLSRAPRSGAGPAPRWFGIHIAAFFNGPDEAIDDDVLVAMDDGLELSHGVLTAAGMRVTPSTGNTVLATFPVSSDESTSEAITAKLCLALDLAARLRAALGAREASAAVSFAIAAHASADRAAIEDLRWAACVPPAGVFATQQTLDGIAARFALRPVPSLEGCYEIERAVEAAPSDPS